MTKEHSKDMTEGSPLKLILSFSLPLLLGNIFQQTYNMVDTAIVGQTLGAKSLAAVGASTSVQFLVLGFCQGLCLGFNVPIGQRFGAKDKRGMHHYEYAGSLMAAVFALALAVLTELLCGPILRALQVPAEIYDQAYQYLAVIFLEIPCAIFYNWLGGMMRAIGDSRTPFIFLAISSVTNIFLDLLFILTFHWGVAGAAVATVLSQALSAVLCFLAIRRQFPILWIPKEARHFNKRDAEVLINMGLPMGLQWSIVAIGSMIMQSANNSLGTLYVSAFTAGAKIKQFVICPFDALATAVSMFVSQNYGAGKVERMRNGIFEGTMIGMIYGALAGVAMFFLGRTLCLLFLNQSQAAALDAAALYLRRMGYFFWILSPLNVLRMSMQGMSFASRAMICGIMEMAARTFVSLAFVSGFGFDAITWTDQMAWISASLYALPMCLHSLKQVKMQFGK